MVKITKIVLNYTTKNYFGDVCDWGNKPGRLMSITYVLENGGFAIKNTSWPQQHTMSFKGPKAAIDWSSKVTAPRVVRMIEKY